MQEKIWEVISKHLQKDGKAVRKETLFEKVWNVLWPLAIYIFAQNAAMLLLGWTKIPILAILAAALVCIPVYYRMCENDRLKAREKKRTIPMESKDVLAIVISGATLALAMNNIIAITPLPRLFPGYEKTNDVIYGAGQMLQILSAGIFGCVVEELSMRGVVYLRMKRYWGRKTAMICSALVFGAYHFNVVQMVYAFVLGLLFAWLYERFDTLWAPIVGHMSANLFILLLSTSKTFEKVVGSWVGFCLVTCVSLIIFQYVWRWMKATDPGIELQFVEKEPDTLEQLTREYKPQDTEEE